ncbi:MAG TPA: DUF2520 domain-containing protein [Acidimicrobiia bacterium]|jgi:predicted short-subunit dehydrogenase-like oxidoreductase (DUF2520 family)|nr:DUF2520 domain-containing protein [Acidimicrobiia bacterium]
MRLIVVGPGRAGGAIALASEAAGHDIVGVLSRHPVDRWEQLDWDVQLPEADIVLIAVTDEAIPEVAARIAPHVSEVGVAAHLSGFTPVLALREIQERGTAVGGFHPLQSLPDAESGAKALEGSFVGIDGDQLGADVLTHLAVTLGMEPFRLDDAARPAYHAAAAAAANFVVTSLAVSADLFHSAGIDPKVSRPLVERAVANVFEKGPAASLTGPIARGDIDTVIGHLTAAHDVSEYVGRQFRLMAEATTIRAGREEDLHRWK